MKLLSKIAEWYRLRAHIPGTRAYLRKEIEERDSKIRLMTFENNRLSVSIQTQTDKFPVYRNKIRKLNMEIEKLKGGTKHLWLERGKFKRGFYQSIRRRMTEVERDVDNNYNPQTGELDGGYAFADYNGRLILSPRMQKVFGLPREQRYEEVITEAGRELLENLGEDKTFKRVIVKVKGKERAIKNVTLSALEISDELFGYEIYFERIGRIEAASARLSESRRARDERKRKKDIENLLNSTEETLHRLDEGVEPG